MTERAESGFVDIDFQRELRRPTKDMFQVLPRPEWKDWQRQQRYEQLAEICRVPRELAASLDVLPGEYLVNTGENTLSAKILSTELYLVDNGTDEYPPFGLTRFFAEGHALVDEGHAVSHRGWRGHESLGVMRTELTESGIAYAVLPSHILRGPIADFNAMHEKLGGLYE